MNLLSVGLLTALLCARPGHADLLCSATGRASGRERRSPEPPLNKVKVVRVGIRAGFRLREGSWPSKDWLRFVCGVFVLLPLSGCYPIGPPNGIAYRPPILFGGARSGEMLVALLIDKCRAIVCNQMQSYRLRLFCSAMLLSGGWRLRARFGA
jgi:hypothetical protein